MLAKTLPIPIDHSAIAAFCRRHNIAALSLFGSVLRDDFGPGSDVDVLIRLQPGHMQTLEQYMEMPEELSRLFENRKVDVVREEYLRNPFLRHEIMKTRELIYVAQS